MVQDPLFSLFRLENSMRLISAATRCLKHIAPSGVPSTLSVALKSRTRLLSGISKEVGGKITSRNIFLNGNFPPSGLSPDLGPCYGT